MWRRCRAAAPRTRATRARDRRGRGRARLVEQRQREPRDLLRVFRLVVAALGQLDELRRRTSGMLIDLRDVPAVAVDVVEHQAFAQRQVAERDLFGAELRRIVSSSTAPATTRSARRGSRPGTQPLLASRAVRRPLCAAGGSLRRHAQVAEFVAAWRHRTSRSATCRG